MLLFSFSDKLTAKKQGRILKINWFWISLIIFIKDTVLFKVFHQVNIIFVCNRNFFTKKHIIYNDERGGDKTRWNSCQNTLKKWKQCRFCLFVFLYLRSVFQCALCISRNTFERIQLRGIAFKGDNRFHVAVHFFSTRSQMTSKCDQKTCDTRGAFVCNIKFGVYLAEEPINNRKCLFKCGILTYKATQTPLKKKKVLISLCSISFPKNSNEFFYTQYLKVAKT